MEQMTCSMCNYTFQGETYDWDTYTRIKLSQVDGAALAYQCKSCNAIYCRKCQKEHVKAIKLSGIISKEVKLLKASCPQCGESFMPNLVLIHYAASIVHQQSLEPANISGGVMRKIKKKLEEIYQESPFGKFEKPASSQEVLDLLRIHGTAFVQKTMGIANNSLDVKAINHLSALGVVGANWLLEDGKVEDFLISLETGGCMENGRPVVSDQEEVLWTRLHRFTTGVPRQSTIPRLVPIAASTKSGKAIQLFVNELEYINELGNTAVKKNQHPKNLHDAPFFVMRFGCMYPDQELVDALIATLNNTYRPNYPPEAGVSAWFIKKEHPSVQEAAIMALVNIGDDRGIAAVIPLVLRQDNFADFTVYKRSTGDFLSQMGHKAVDPLIEALSTGNTDVRGRAAWGLGLIGDIKAVDPLIAIIEADETALNSAEALGKLGDVRAVEPLLNAFKDLKGVRNSINRKIYRDAIKQIVSKHPEDISIAESLILALKDEDAKFRMLAAESLGITGGERAVNALTEALNDKDRKVQKAAQKALKTIKVKV